MRKIVRKGNGTEGFTLIELMIVVAIVGVLAVLAIYGVRKYIASSKTAEARNSLGQIGNDAKKVYDGETMSPGALAQGSSTAVLRALCASATASVPTTKAGIAGKKYQSAPAEWNTDQATNAGFACLKFVLDSPQYFMYNYTAVSPGNAVGNTFTATANGDLNGDGVLSTFSLTGVIGSGLVLNVSPSIGEVLPEE